MRETKKKKVIRLLGVGFDADDGHVRITKGENYDVLMGSDESHEYIQELIQTIEAELKDRGLTLDDMSPKEFSAFVKTVM
jgi:hypothetical protein